MSLFKIVFDYVMYTFFNILIHFDKNKLNCFLFIQHCDYLIVSINIEFIYKIVVMSIIFVSFSKGCKNEIRGKQIKKNCKLNANTEGIQMANLSLDGALLWPNVCGLTVARRIRWFHRHIPGCRDMSWLSST